MGEFHGNMEKVKITLQRNQYPQKFYDATISNTIEKRVSAKVNQKDQEEDATSLKSNVVKQNVFIEYGEISTGPFIKRVRSIGALLQPVINFRKMRTCLPSLKNKIEKKPKASSS